MPILVLARGLLHIIWHIGDLRAKTPKTRSPEIRNHTASLLYSSVSDGSRLADKHKVIGVRSPFDDNFKPRTATPSSPALATYRQEMLCVMVGPWVRIATIGRIGQTET